MREDTWALFGGGLVAFILSATGWPFLVAVAGGVIAMQVVKGGPWRRR